MSDRSIPEDPLNRCDICAVRGEIRKLVRFALTRTLTVRGKKTTRGCGTIQLCRRCWETGPALRRRNPDGPPRSASR